MRICCQTFSVVMGEPDPIFLVFAAGLFNVGISSALNGRPMENWYATFASDSCIKRRPTLIRDKGNLSTYLPYSDTAKSYFGLNVLVVFKITLCEHNLNFGKTKQYAIRQRKLKN